MARVVRFEPAPDSSSSHDLTVHIEHARARQQLRDILKMIEKLSRTQPMVAVFMLQLFQRFLSDLPK